jgi:hypothetical protein
LEEGRKRRWDIALGIAAPLITVAGVLFGAWQFNFGEEDKGRLDHTLVLEKDEIEFQRKLWLERLTAYRSVAELSALQAWLVSARPAS